MADRGSTNGSEWENAFFRACCVHGYHYIYGEVLEYVKNPELTNNRQIHSGCGHFINSYRPLAKKSLLTVLKKRRLDLLHSDRTQATLH